MNDGLRAAVFARDKGLCAFSGLSVWYLDYGMAPFSHADWVDHIKPKSRGGRDTLDNLVCASFFYNRKKVNNGSDNQYLFLGGKPTDTFFRIFGELSSQQSKLLSSHAVLNEADWYFNRAIFNIVVAIDNDIAGIKAARDREYWLNSARKRMRIWRQLSGGQLANFEKRGLVPYPGAEDTQLILSLADAPERQWLPIYRKLLKLAKENEKVFAKFLKASDRRKQLDIVSAAEASRAATQPFLDALRRNCQLL